LCLTLAGFRLPTTRPGLWLGMAAIAFAAVVALLIPSKSYAYRGGWLSVNSAVVYTATAVPLAIGSTLVLNHWFAGPRRAVAVPIASARRWLGWLGAGTVLALAI